MKCSACHAQYEDGEPQCPQCGAMPAQKKARSIDFANAPRVAPPRQCHAHGCLLSGTFNPVAYGEEKGYWVCFLHADLPISEWQRATAAINRALPALRPITNVYAFHAALRKAMHIDQANGR